MPDDLPPFDAESPEERPVHDRPHLFVAPAVGGGRVGHQLERYGEDLMTGLQLLVGAGQAVLDVAAFGSDGRDLVAELVLGPAFLGGEVEEVGLLVVEHVQAPFVLSPQVLAEFGALGHGRVYRLHHLVAEVRR